MLAAGLLAKKAVERGWHAKPWVKTSLAPGSRGHADYFDRPAWTPSDALGFHTVGYGCTTCIGNSGPLPEAGGGGCGRGPGRRSRAQRQSQLRGSSQPAVQGELPGQPAAGGRLRDGRPRRYRLRQRAHRHRRRRPAGMLAELWPSTREIETRPAAAVKPELFAQEYAQVFAANAEWNADSRPRWLALRLGPGSTYVREPFFVTCPRAGAPSRPSAGAACWLLGDSATRTTSPRRLIAAARPARRVSRRRTGVARRSTATAAARQSRGDGTRHLRQHPPAQPLVPGVEGGWTTYLPASKISPFSPEGAGEDCRAFRGAREVTHHLRRGERATGPMGTPTVGVGG